MNPIICPFVFHHVPFFVENPFPTLPYTLVRFILEFRAILKEYAHQSRHATLDV